MGVTRPDPPETGAEKESLAGFLDFHRATLEMKCEGLSPEQLCERAVSPSALSLLGLVRHLASAERGWFQRRFLGLDVELPFASETDERSDIHAASPDDVAEALATWRAECESSRKVLADHDLEEVAVELRRGKQISLRWIATHMLEEYARHNGHADLLRERLDGSTGV